MREAEINIEAVLRKLKELHGDHTSASTGPIVVNAREAEEIRKAYGGMPLLPSAVDPSICAIGTTVVHICEDARDGEVWTGNPADIKEALRLRSMFGDAP